LSRRDPVLHEGLDWLADDAVHGEPVSGAEFPDNREKYREICRLLLPESPAWRENSPKSGLLQHFPYAP
jgi:hypothetical protein